MNIEFLGPLLVPIEFRKSQLHGRTPFESKSATPVITSCLSLKERSKHIYDCVIKLTRKTDFKLPNIS